jgi:DNA-binding MltR family transcriptional regulator
MPESNASKPEDQNSESANDWDAFYKELQKESQRGGVLLGAAFLDEQLRQLLEAFLIDHSASGKLLEGGAMAPLGSFSSRINMAFCLGLISKDIHGDLHIIREIRNEFAHSLHGLTFANEKIQTLVSKLKWPKKLAEFSSTWDNMEPGGALLISISMHANQLRINTIGIKRREVKRNEDVGFYVGGDKKKGKK